jgi:opacity protein-like surface antigen
MCVRRKSWAGGHEHLSMTQEKGTSSMRTLAALSTVVLLLFVASAVSPAQIEFGIGLKTGLNFGTLSLTPETLGQGVTKGGRTGFMIGAAGELGFAKMFYITLEPTYCGKGCQFTAGTTTQTLAYNYLNLPVLFKVKFLKGMVRPYAFAGPNLGILLSASSTVEGAQGAQGGSTDIKQFTSGSDFAIDFGGGAEFNVIPKLGLTADVRYSLGLSDINNTPAAPGGTALKINTRGFQILIGAMFHVL